MAKAAPDGLITLASEPIVLIIGSLYGGGPMNSALNGRHGSSSNWEKGQCNPACWGPLGNMAIPSGRSDSVVAVIVRFALFMNLRGAAFSVS